MTFKQIALFLSALGACTPNTTARPIDAASNEGAPPAIASEPRPSPPLDAGGVAADRPASPEESDAAPPKAGPVAVTRSGKIWPFHAWTRAQAVKFNSFEQRPEVPLVAYGDSGWSNFIDEKKAIDQSLAKKAVELLFATSGDVEVSKCPFPRHAVVLFDGDQPIASINVCFQCGDILVWPSWEPTPEKTTKAESEAREVRELMRQKKGMKAYDYVFPKWKKFFADEVKLPITSGTPSKKDPFGF